MNTTRMSVAKSLAGAGVLLTLLGAGCTSTTTTNTATVTTPTNTDTTVAVVDTAVIDPTAMPVDFPNSTLDAEFGDYVLAPTRAALDEAATEGVENGTFIYYMAKVAEVGETASVLTEINEEVTIPNGVIIPIPAGQTAAVGDTVLTWWQSGSGMSRAYVVEGGTATEPMVRYLDTGFFEDEEPEQLESDSFVVITDPMQAGASIGVKNGSEYDHYQVLNVSGDQVLVSGFAGSLKVVDTADVVTMPIKPSVSVGDAVSVPFIGSYTKGTVTAVDDANGTVDVEVDWAGEPEVDTYPYGDVILSAEL
ncbi:MAG: hypothetical protein HY565_00890 [Candidatus Kerfeldbacteria bacterium]|nr:hypothetical protein [Candidatus Kerfeldbacteria bacterium]